MIRTGITGPTAIMHTVLTDVASVAPLRTSAEHERRAEQQQERIEQQRTEREEGRQEESKQERIEQ
eukprot:7844957-Lingulodinium_polyedra.AAC.1